MLRPAVVLVRPQMGENIGAAARAMMNFGLSDLRLVAPRDGWPNPKAHEMAAHADGIIEQARIYPTLAEALGDCHYALAATARPREMALPEHTPESMAEALRRKEAEGGHTALVFGPENAGLNNDDLTHMHGIVQIPTDPGNRSLNVAQSVVILAYSWFRAAVATVPQEEAPLAELAEIDGLYDHLRHALERRAYFRPEAKRPGMQRSLRLLLRRAAWSPQEVRTLRGMVRCLDEERPDASEN